MKKYILISLLSMIVYLDCFAYTYSVKIGDLRYDLNNGDNTAMVVYQAYDQEDAINYVGLTKIVIPATVQYEGTTYRVASIQNRAFYGCPDLETIEIGENIERIGYSGNSSYVFMNSPKLNKVIWRAKNCKGFADFYNRFTDTVFAACIT